MNGDGQANVVPERAPAAPDGVDLDKPSSARIYDSYLGGDTNFAVDRVFAEQADQEFPLIRPLAQSNRLFLGDVVEAAVDAGITQFLDLGSGVPSVGNVHQIVARRAPAGADCRVVYVDYEPVAVAHTQNILEQEDALSWAGVVHGDLRQPKQVLADPAVKNLLDFSKPVCVLLISVLHFVGDADGIPGIISGYRKKMAPGSWLAASHITTDDAPADGAAQLQRLAAKYRGTQNPAWIRTKDEFTTWFAGFDLEQPGVVHLTDWRRRDRAEVLFPKLKPEAVRPYYWAAVGRVPQPAA